MGILYSKNLSEIVRDQKAILSRSIREIQRDLRRLDEDEKQLIGELKNESVNVLARNVAQVRIQRKRLIKAKGDLTRNCFYECISKFDKSMCKIQRAAISFQRQSEILGAKQEILEEVFEDFNCETEDEHEEYVKEVLEEIGIFMDDVNDKKVKPFNETNDVEKINNI